MNTTISKARFEFGILLAALIFCLVGMGALLGGRLMKQKMRHDYTKGAEQADYVWRNELLGRRLAEYDRQTGKFHIREVNDICADLAIIDPTPIPTSTTKTP